MNSVPGTPGSELRWPSRPAELAPFLFGVRRNTLTWRQRAATSRSVSVLIFSKTEGYRHESIPAGVDAVSGLARARGLAVAATEDAGRFCPEVLENVRIVVWLSTIGPVL